MKLRRLAPLAILASLPAITGFDCGGSDGGGPTASEQTLRFGGLSVKIARDSFALFVYDQSGRLLLESAPARQVEAADPMRSYAPLAVTHNTDESVPVLSYGWNHYRGEDGPWGRSGRVTELRQEGERTIARIELDHAACRGATLTLEPRNGGLHVALVADPAPPDVGPNRVSLAFKMHDDDHFLGFGERFVRSDHRGQHLYTWVEDGGFGKGEDVPPGRDVPSPSGEGETNVPIPWFLSPRGFGMLAEGTTRMNYHLGDQAPDAWRVESTTDRWEATIFASPDPLALVESLTAITGRPPEIADWVLAPRRRANIGTPEAQKLRDAKIPTSVIDTALHYFPNGIPKELEGAGVKAVTDDLHRRGFKAIAYFNAHVSVDWHPVYDEAAAKGYLLKREGGAPYTVLVPPYTVGVVDFTNPEAVAWYQGWLKRALDDGWDGWMYDFAEYVPQDAVFANGMRGFEAHNLYPVLYQKAAFELLERERRRDYLIFVRSGFAGTGGLVPMVWAGDQNTDFSASDGLPAALTGALNAGMSGLPLWGSDISGYHYIYNPPPDKEVYLRWTELGAFSADMHDENEGSGNGPNSARWQIWNDQETLDTYRKYATYKTRMLPYVRAAVEQARARGTPVMRHLYLMFPGDPRTISIADEYMYGDALLVAPVVARGQRQRSVYLPAGDYYDFWTGERVAGGRDVQAQAPLDVVPVYARMGALVPMLASDVQTVVPVPDKSVVSLDDRRDFLEVLVFAGGDSSFTLDDGVTIAQHAPREQFDPGAPTLRGAPLPAAASEADLATCNACAWRAPDRKLMVAFSTDLSTGEERVEAGAFSFTVRKSAPQAGPGPVKRYLATIRF
jgi:alpha-glucosidase (family GH31 glycosyl hydrolase)